MGQSDVESIFDRFSRFDTKPKCNRRTDGIARPISRCGFM